MSSYHSKKNGHAVVRSLMRGKHLKIAVGGGGGNLPANTVIFFKSYIEIPMRCLGTEGTV